MPTLPVRTEGPVLVMLERLRAANVEADPRVSWKKVSDDCT